MPVIFGVAQAFYLPHFTGPDRYLEFLAYLQFRGYLFLGMFCVAGIGTIAILLIFKPKTWFSAGLGIGICFSVLNIVYIWSADPFLTFLENVLYTQTEDGNIYYVTNGYIWTALFIGGLVCVIAFLQGYLSSYQQSSITRRLLRAVSWMGMVGAITVLPLTFDVYFLAPSEFNVHVTNDFLLNFTNADLLYVALIALIGSVTINKVVGAQKMGRPPAGPEISES